ncbi:MAG: pyridoxal-phosphate dependent enzyme, partial [Halobacteriaceae archaeon]
GPLKNALENDLDHIEPVETDSTIAFSIGGGISSYQGLTTLRESNGTAITVNDDTIRELQQTLGETTGIYSEAAAVASVAGVRSLAMDGTIKEDDTVIALNTSTGLKDTEMTAETLPEVPTIEPDIDDLRVTLQTQYNVEI